MSEIEELKERMIEVFKKVEDPEIHIDVWTLGLIYEFNVNENKRADIKMTFTSPMCPYGPALVADIEDELKKVGVNEVSIDIVFSPPWQPSDEVKEMLGLL